MPSIIEVATALSGGGAAAPVSFAFRASFAPFNQLSLQRTTLVAL